MSRPLRQIRRGHALFSHRPLCVVGVEGVGLDAGFGDANHEHVVRVDAGRSDRLLVEGALDGGDIAAATRRRW